jgi:uncharacterized Fe-S center protein
MKNSLVIGAMLFVSTLAFAGPKSFTVTFDKPATVGSVTLAPGEYKVKVDGANAVFTNNFSYKSVTTPVKVETGEKKFKDTAVDSVRNGAGETVNSIAIGGSTTKLEFGKQSAASN